MRTVVADAHDWHGVTVTYATKPIVLITVTLIRQVYSEFYRLTLCVT